MKTVWVETANDGAKVDVVDPVRLGRLVDALHARGVRVVAWYLPGHVKPALDLRRALAMLSFSTPTGGSFDGVALDIESTKLRNVSLRSQRAVALTRQLRAAAGDTPLAIVPFNPRGLERRPSTWPRFPWADLAASADAFAPMVYTGGGLKGFDATYGYVTRALRLLRVNTGDPDVQIHVAGGVADRLGPEELAGFVAAVADDGDTIGVSLYDWMTTHAADVEGARAARRLARPGRPQEVARLEQVLGNHLHIGEHGHEVRVARPAWDDVLVDVVGDAGACRMAEVPAEVESARAVHAVERVDRGDGEAVDLECLLVGELAELADVTARRDHEVPRRVRVLVQEGERGIAEDDEERLLGRDRARGLVAEDAPGVLARLLDVLETPRCPQGLRHGVVSTTACTFVPPSS